MNPKQQQRRRTTVVIRRISSPKTISHNISLSLRIASLFFLVFVFSYVLLNGALDSCQIRLPEYLVSSTDMLSSSLFFDSLSDRPDNSLETVLRKASMDDNTVILTTLNKAWANPDNSILDLFLSTFKSSHQTSRLLNHLVIIALDQNAFAICKRLHTHCFALTTQGVDFSQEAYFMSPDYLKMMWRRIDFLRSVLEMGYNFLFTDADIMWFRDPFPHFYPDADFQIACDHYSGNSTDVETNIPNGGFSFVRSNVRSIEFYKYWYSSREVYPGMHDQDVLNNIKFDSIVTDIKLKLRFLDTTYFGGFCEPSKDLNKVCTMHANCCVGLENKVHDLKIMLQDWNNFMGIPPGMRSESNLSWTPPKNCSLALRRHFDLSEDMKQMIG